MVTVVGVLEDRPSAEDAIETLVQNGIDRDALGVMWRDKAVAQPETIKTVGYQDHHSGAGAEAVKGAVGGAVGGGAAGAGTVLLASAGVALLPGVGALLAAGTVAASAMAAGAGAVGGGATGGLIGALIGSTDNGASKVVEEQKRFRTALDRDGFVLAVETPEGDAVGVVGMLRDAGAEDVAVLHEPEGQTSNAPREEE